LLHIALVEDDDATRDQLQSFLNRYATEHSQEFQISPFRDGNEILSGYHPSYDIIFLDIEMPGINGMDTAEQIRAQDSEVTLVFITNLVQYAIRGYAVRALDYVLKPISYGTFALKLEKAIKMADQHTSGKIILRLPDGIQRLSTREIYYVEVQRGVLRYVTALGEFNVRGTLQSVEANLQQYHFVRCNYWYLVNLLHVSRVSKEKVEVAGIELQISRRNKNAFMAALTEYVGGGF